MKPHKPLVHLAEAKKSLHQLLEKIEQDGYAEADLRRQSNEAITNELEIPNGEEYQISVQIYYEDKKAKTLMVSGDICYHGTEVHRWWQIWRTGHTPISYEGFKLLPDGRTVDWYQHDGKRAMLA